MSTKTLHRCGAGRGMEDGRAKWLHLCAAAITQSMSRSIVAAIEQLSYANLHPFGNPSPLPLPSESEGQLCDWLTVRGMQKPIYHASLWPRQSSLYCLCRLAKVLVNGCLPYLLKDLRANLSRIKQKLSTHTETAKCRERESERGR